ncbi:MAG: DUF5615 family PIN-like protein [Chitinivibrionales bacterium]|nr:DUF5615 family PIN-like protein [Chitinivibrionales bacterium]
MKFFLDENFPRSCIKILNSEGHDAYDIRGTEQEGFPDEKIFAEAQKLEAVFLTTDRDFFHTIPFSNQRHSGIIVVALSQPNAAKINQKLIWALQFLKSRSIQSRCLMLTDNKIYFTQV